MSHTTEGLTVQADGAAQLDEAPFFFTKRKSGSLKPVDIPVLEAPAADTHAHLHYLDDPVEALARAAVCGVELVGYMIDVAEDGQTPLDALEGWVAQAQERLPQTLAYYQRWLSDQEKQEVFGGVEASAAEGVAGDAVQDAAGSAAVEGAAVEGAAAKGAAVEGAAVEGAAKGASLKLPQVRICVGVHPHNASKYTPEVEAALLRYAARPQVVAIGEVGLDYHYDMSPRARQQEVFVQQIHVAHETGLPLALHVREAYQDAFRILEQEGWPKAGTLLHCYTADPETLQPWIEAGCYAAFGGALTFGNGESIRESAAKVPLDRLLTETDAPYMAPVPLRGLPCEPAQVLFTAQRLAQVRGVQEGPQRQEFLQQLLRNAYDFLDREPSPWQRQHGLR